MDDIDILSEKLEGIIIQHLNGGVTFNIPDVQAEWEKQYPDTPFKTVFTKLFAQNKVGAANRITGEYRDPIRTD
jgi:hypothetical protein